MFLHCRGLARNFKEYLAKNNIISPELYAAELKSRASENESFASVTSSVIEGEMQVSV